MMMIAHSNPTVACNPGAVQCRTVANPSHSISAIRQFALLHRRSPPASALRSLNTYVLSRPTAPPQRCIVACSLPTVAPEQVVVGGATQEEVCEHLVDRIFAAAQPHSR